MKRAILQLACVFLLLFAQQSALTHAAWHAHKQPLVQHDGKDKASFQGSLCNLHVAFSQVLGGMHASPLQPPAPEHFSARIERPICARVVADPPPFFSQGPPASL